MSKKASSTRIGIFVIVSFFLLVAGAVLFGGGKLFSSKNTVIVYFEGSLQGLSVGAPVAYRGITIGEVKEIQLDIDTSTYQIIVPVLISLIPNKIIKTAGNSYNNYDLNTFLKIMCDRGLRASVKSQSLLTGKLYIDLAIYENSKAVYHDKAGKYLEIPTVPSELQQMTQAMKSLNFEELAVKFSNTLDALEKMSISLEQAMNSETTKEKLAVVFASLDNFHSILSKVDNNMIPLLNKLDFTLDKVSGLADNSSQMIDNIDTTARDTGLAMRATELFMTGMNQSTSIESPLYYQLTEGVNELGKTAKALRTFLDYLDRNPQRLLFGSEQQDNSSQ
jgi:paraquat-inducible protein B